MSGFKLLRTPPGSLVVFVCLLMSVVENLHKGKKKFTYRTLLLVLAPMGAISYASEEHRTASLTSQSSC